MTYFLVILGTLFTGVVIGVTAYGLIFGSGEHRRDD